MTGRNDELRHALQPRGKVKVKQEKVNKEKKHKHKISKEK